MRSVYSRQTVLQSAVSFVEFEQLTNTIDAQWGGECPDSSWPVGRLVKSQSRAPLRNLSTTLRHSPLQLLN